MKIQPSERRETQMSDYSGGHCGGFFRSNIGIILVIFVLLVVIAEHRFWW